MNFNVEFQTLMRFCFLQGKCVFTPWESHAIKVSKFQKQIFLFSFEPKNECNYFFILP